MMNKFDIYITIPVSTKKNLIEMKKTEDSYVSRMDSLSKYECRRKISKSIERTKMNETLLAYYSDDNYDEAPSKYIKCEATYTYQSISKLGLIVLILRDFEDDPTMIGDMVSSKEYFRIQDGEKLINHREWLEKYNLTVCGKNRVIYFSGRNEIDKLTLKALLAGQAKTSKMMGTDVAFNDNFYEIDSVTNYAKYNFYDLYISERNIVKLCDGYGEINKDDIEDVAQLMYICEIAIMQNAAISRINDKIVQELTANSNISSKKILDMLVEFGKTITLWDNNIYNYSTAQEISNDIVKAFKTDELMREYNKNSKHLSEIATIKSDIASGIESKILNLLAFILAVNELTTIIPNFINFINGRRIEVVEVGSSIAIIIVILVVLRNNFKKNKGKNK